MGDVGFPPLTITRRTGTETFRLAGKPLPITVHDFWCWYVSDLVSNTTRGVLAEFIVASAVGAVDGIRNEWDAYDLKTATGIRIEVKSASYLQSWFHAALSPIIFSIEPTQAWDRETAKSAQDRRRQADVYVMSVLAHQEKASLDPLDLEQWDFYVIETKVLNEKVPTQKKITLSSLRNLGASKCQFPTLAATIEDIGGNSIELRSTATAPTKPVSGA